MSRLAPLLIVVAVAALGPGLVGARAASFDCAKPATARERLICTDPALSAADDRLAATYDAALPLLTADGQKQLRDGQGSWLHYLDATCGLVGRPIPAPRGTADTPKSCLTSAYQERQDQLDRATTSLAGFVFLRAETFTARPSYDRYGLIKRDIAYPQIDRPRGDAEKRWNAAIRARIAALARKTKAVAEDRTIDYRLASVTPRLISTVITDYAYPHGAAHGGEAVLAMNWLLGAHRNLDASDIFAADKPWQDALAQAAFAQLRHNFDPDTLAAKDPGALRSSVAEPQRWAIEPGGFGVLFQQYEVGPYVIGHPEAIVPWPDLQPLLAAHLPFDIPPR